MISMKIKDYVFRYIIRLSNKAIFDEAPVH